MVTSSSNVLPSAPSLSACAIASRKYRQCIKEGETPRKRRTSAEIADLEARPWDELTDKEKQVLHNHWQWLKRKRAVEAANSSSAAAAVSVSVFADADDAEGKSGRSMFDRMMEEEESHEFTIVPSPFSSTASSPRSSVSSSSSLSSAPVACHCQITNLEDALRKSADEIAASSSSEGDSDDELLVPANEEVRKEENQLMAEMARQRALKQPVAAESIGHVWKENVSKLCKTLKMILKSTEFINDNWCAFSTRGYDLAKASSGDRTLLEQQFFAMQDDPRKTATCEIPLYCVSLIGGVVHHCTRPHSTVKGRSIPTAHIFFRLANPDRIFTPGFQVSHLRNTDGYLTRFCVSPFHLALESPEDNYARNRCARLFSRIFVVATTQQRLPQ